ncbi:hypothetical protein [Altibacter sp. HG106]|uniref:hypothetical protein n=1 Tax=Altibacter sp. HG106 TaxID=3023937 RepID=UPI00234FDC2E|nr:hypothetical protein [Altibacter sp. HG106]MDC7996378.1 hypothetical protein [Altibacter sp. HG106]
MKIFYLILGFFFSISLSFSQSFCTTNTITYGKESYHSGHTDMNFMSETPLVLNIFFHDYQTVTLTEDDYLRAVADLNINYNQFNIFFKYRGFELINGTATPQNDMLNVHIQDIPGGTALNTSYILVSYTAFQTNPQILLHEIGHIFGLLHTFQGTGRTLMTFNNPLFCEFDPVGQLRTEGWFPTFTTNSENVTRNQTSGDFNADEAGDFVTDTFAAYENPNFCRDLTTGDSYYIFSNEVKDNATGVKIPYVDIDATNIMLTVESPSDYPFLRDFTPGQGVRMRETIINNNSVFGPILQDVSVLYDPYKGEYYFAGPLPQNGPPTFQPGFDYRFVECECDCPIPRDYENTNFTFDLSTVIASFDKNESDFASIIHPNHSAIRIVQLDESPIQPRRCYDNFNKAPNGGSVTRFNDGVFNSNVTVTPKDSVGINEPNLIYDLPSGLYVIDKYYDDGSENQTTLIKEDE